MKSPLMQTDFTHHKIMNPSQKADKSPLMQIENMSWEELIDRLLAIQKARNLPPSWVIDRIEECGHPPKQIWRATAKALHSAQFWADNWKWLPGQETEEPDFGAIDWQKYPIPDPPPPPEPIPKPVLRSPRV
jgi:hypothetical protein